ncbi:MAG: hypothetical protein AB1798_05390 [Spirochaetota bacterium]
MPRPPLSAKLLDALKAITSKIQAINKEARKISMNLRCILALCFSTVLTLIDRLYFLLRISPTI